MTRTREEVVARLMSRFIDRVDVATTEHDDEAADLLLRAFDAGHDAGRAQERAAVVACLRDRAECCDGALADYFERAAHVRDDNEPHDGY